MYMRDTRIPTFSSCPAHFSQLRPASRAEVSSILTLCFAAGFGTKILEWAAFKIGFVLCILTATIISLSSCATSFILNPPSFYEALEAHEILDLHRTRFRYIAIPNSIYITIYLQNDDYLFHEDFSMDTLLAILASIGKYMQTPQLIEYLSGYPPRIGILSEPLRIEVDIRTASDRRIMNFNNENINQFDGMWTITPFRIGVIDPVILDILDICLEAVQNLQSKILIKAKMTT